MDDTLAMAEDTRLVAFSHVRTLVVNSGGRVKGHGLMDKDAPVMQDKEINQELIN